MNQLMQTQWSMVEGTHGMRAELMDALTDADLGFNMGGQTMTLGALCREMGEVDHAYLQSFKTFKQDWDYKNTEPGLDCSVERLKAWYAALEADMKATLAALSDDDLTKTIDRNGYPMPLNYQLEAYLQALLIFLGKASIYLRAMNKPLPEKIKEWIW